MTYQLPDLSYGFDALEPVIDRQTMEIHHDKHHAGYVKKLNDAVKNHDEYAELEINELCRRVADLPEGIRTAVRNNGGGHCNHALFWTIMQPPGEAAPEGDLANAINRTFGSFNELRQRFTDAATGRFGSGWAWLGVKDDGELCVCSTPNQDNPLMRGVVECPCEPILGLDVWEHAYYLKYQNKRPEYVENWWKVVNWKQVDANFTAALDRVKGAAAVG